MYCGRALCLVPCDGRFVLLTCSVVEKAVESAVARAPLEELNP